MTKASGWAAGFRIAARREESAETVDALYQSVTVAAESVVRVPFHPHEEVFQFEDGSLLLFSHENLLGVEVSRQSDHQIFDILLALGKSA